MSDGINARAREGAPRHTETPGFRETDAGAECGNQGGTEAARMCSVPIRASGGAEAPTDPAALRAYCERKGLASMVEGWRAWTHAVARWELGPGQWGAFYDAGRWFLLAAAWGGYRKLLPAPRVGAAACAECPAWTRAADRRWGVCTRDGGFTQERDVCGAPMTSGRTA